ncbi:hypothetical protein [Micromonospora sp. NPDC048947]|uniref:esterase/lipase family protein n=1 Tax=Micromonospora sp. NPDC048947 TaxID=3154826 RepID=UPI0033C7F8E1
MRRLNVFLTLVLLGAFTPDVALPVLAEPAGPTMPGSCEFALGTKLQLRDEQRNEKNQVVRRSQAGSAALKYHPDAIGSYSPVLLVHGFNGSPGFKHDGWPKPGAFDKPITMNAGGAPIADSPRSLVGQFQAIPGAAVFELDYQDRNQQWVAGTDNAGTRVAKAIDCLAEGFGRKVVVVAHSMGGLATRWAVTAAEGAVERANRISTVITFGTPYTGSAIAEAASTLLTNNGASRVVAGIAEIVKFFNRLLSSCEGKSDDACDIVRGLLSGLDTPAAQALRISSEQLRDAQRWPGQIRVFALAGQIELQGRTCTTLGCVAGTPWKVGDTAVLQDSATADATEHVTVTCKYVYNADVASFYNTAKTALGGPCQHSNLMSEIHLTNNAVAEVADAVASALPVYAYVTAKELVIARHDHITRSAGGTFQTAPRWTVNGRYTFAVSKKKELVVIDSRGGAVHTIKCRCTAAAPIGDAGAGWVDDKGRLMLADLGTVADPRVVPVRVPTGTRLTEALTGTATEMLVVGRVNGGDKAIMIRVRPDGQTTLVHQFPELQEVMAAAAANGRFSFAVIESSGDCGHPGPVYLAGTDAGAPVETDTTALTPAGSNAEVGIQDAWWSGDGKLYATLHSWVCDPYGGVPVMPLSLWRLDGTKWVSVDGGPVRYVRQLSRQLKAVVLEDGSLYSEVNGAGVKIATGVTGLAAPPWTGAVDPAVAPSGKPRTKTVEPCPTKEQFRQQADRQGYAIFEHTTVKFTVLGSVVCQAGWAYAAVTGYSIDYIIMRYQGGQWQWAADPYWKQFGEPADLCAAMPSKIKSALRCR